MNNHSISFIIVFNILASITLLLNDIGFISLDSIWMRLIFNLFFIWNILLLYLITKSKKNEKNK